MDILDILFSRTAVTIFLSIVCMYCLYKVPAEADESEEHEDIEGHIADINESQTPDQVIERYQRGVNYNELRSNAFVHKMAELHEGQSLS